jgi:hypothetical protein
VEYDYGFRRKTMHTCGSALCQEALAHLSHKYSIAHPS